MNAYLSKFFKQSFHYTLGEIFIMLSGFISFPILTRIFTPSDYGILSVISITLWLLLAFAKAGLQESTIRFYDEYTTNSVAGRKAIFYTTLFYGSLIFALTFSVLIVIFGRLIFPSLLGIKTEGFVWILVGLLLSNALSLRMENFLRAEQRTKLLNTVMVASRYLGLTISLGLVFLVSKSLKTYYLGLIISESLIGIFLVFMFLKRMTLSPRNFSASLLKNFFLFGFPLIGFELGHFLIKSSDRYIIQILMGSSAVGIFSAAANLCLYLKDLVLFPLMYAITPIYMEIWNKKGPQETGAFISKVTKICMIIIIPLVFGFVALGKDLIIILASDKFQDAAPLIGLMIPGTILWGLSPIFAAGLYIQKRTKTMTLIVILGVVFNIGLNFTLIPRLGLMGAAITTLVSYTLPSILLAIASSKIVKIKLDFQTTLICSVSAVGMYLILNMSSNPLSIFSFIIKVLIAILTYAGLVLVLHGGYRRTLIKILREYLFLFRDRIWNSVGD